MRLVLCTIVEEFDYFRFSSIMSDCWSTGKRLSTVRLRSIDYAGVVSRPFVLSLNNLKPPKTKEVKTPLYKKSLYFVVNFYTKYKAVIIQEKFILRLTFNPVLAFTFRTTGPTSDVKTLAYGKLFSPLNTWNLGRTWMTLQSEFPQLDVDSLNNKASRK